MSDITSSNKELSRSKREKKVKVIFDPYDMLIIEKENLKKIKDANIIKNDLNNLNKDNNNIIKKIKRKRNKWIESSKNIWSDYIKIIVKNLSALKRELHFLEVHLLNKNNTPNLTNNNVNSIDIEANRYETRIIVSKKAIRNTFSLIAKENSCDRVWPELGDDGDEDGLLGYCYYYYYYYYYYY
jgi:hypothetical protein